MKITNPEQVVAEIDAADKRLAEAETPALKQVRKLAALKIEEQRAANVAAQAAQDGISPSLAKVRALADAKIADNRQADKIERDAMPTPEPQPEFTIPRSPESESRLRRETQHKLDQMNRRLIRARKLGLDKVAEVQAEIQDLKRAIKSDDSFNSLDVFERQRAIRKELKTARAAGDSERVSELSREAGFLQRQQSRLGSLRFVSIAPEESE